MIKTITIKAFAILVLAVAIAIPSFAQNKNDSSMSDYSTPGSFHKMLVRSNGTWTGEVTMWFAPDAPPTTSTSILNNTMTTDGRFQVSEIKGNVTGQGKPFSSVRITGYDIERKVFTRAMIGDGNGGVAMEGAWDEATKSITMPFRQVDRPTGKLRSLKEVYKIVDENTEILEIYDIDPKTEKEFKVLNIIWTRNK